MDSNQFHARHNKMLFREERQSDLAKEFTNELVYREIAQLASGKNSRILEVGCGDGLLLNKLVKKDLSVIGVDMVLRGLTTSDQLRPCCIETNFLEWTPSEKFDIVVSVESLEHFPDYCVSLLKIRDLLKPDGFFVVTVPNNWPFEVETCPHCGEKYEKLGHLWKFTRSGFRKDLEQLFEVIFIKTVYSQFWDAVEMGFKKLFHRPLRGLKLELALDRIIQKIIPGRYLIAVCRLKEELSPENLSTHSKSLEKSREYRKSL